MMLLPEMNRGVRGREGEKEEGGREGRGGRERERKRGRERRDREIVTHRDRQQRSGLGKPRGYGGGAGCWTRGRNPT